MNNQQTQKTTSPLLHNHDELVLVVKREKMFPHGSWQGLKAINGEEYLSIIAQEKEFLPREHMETDPAFKQVIPYLIFKHGDKYFLMQRQSKSTDQRLKNKYSLGIGGHIRQEDMESSDIVDWARREFEEEVSFSGNYTVTTLGMLNDDSDAVGQVHVGYVFLLEGDSSHISVKSELKSGQLLTLNECEAYYESMENWTKIVFDFIKSQK